MMHDLGESMLQSIKPLQSLVKLSRQKYHPNERIKTEHKSVPFMRFLLALGSGLTLVWEYRIFWTLLGLIVL